MEMRLPRSVVEIIDRLESLGYEAYAVGGCVRDTLLGREPEDWDITTSAKPEAVKKEACKHATSNGGSGMPLKGIGECTLCVGIA